MNKMSEEALEMPGLEKAIEKGFEEKNAEEEAFDIDRLEKAFEKSYNEKRAEFESISKKDFFSIPVANAFGGAISGVTIRNKEKTVTNWINSATVAAAGIGALPLPGSDIIPLTTLQVALAMKIASIYGIKPSKSDVMTLVASTVTGTVGKQVMRWAITALKAAGWLPGGQGLEIVVSAIASTVAASITYGFGWACNAYFKSGETIDSEEIADIFKHYSDEYRKKPKD
jgi:uncharacterized protein (DUF697 family)